MTQKHDGYFWKNCRQMLDERFGIGSDAARIASQGTGIDNNPPRRSSVTNFADGHILLSCGRNRRESIRSRSALRDLPRCPRLVQVRQEHRNSTRDTQLFSLAGPARNDIADVLESACEVLS